MRVVMRVVVVLALVWAAPALAGGSVFARDAAQVGLPDARALIAWADGQQTLVLEPRVGGAGRELAWVVPLPATPEVSPVGEGLFPTLEVVFAPEVLHDTGAAWLFVLLGLLPVGLAVVCGELPRTTIGCALPLVAVVGIAVLPLLGATVGPPRVVGQVRPVARADVPSGYRLTTLAGDEAGALAARLRASGYAAPGVAEAARRHASSGGVFVVVQLEREVSDLARALHPLCFRFAASAPVCPLPLVADGGPLDLELFVFGPKRAAADGLRTIRCSQAVRIGDEGYVHLAPTDAVAVAHPTLARLVGEAGVATRLGGRLTGAQGVLGLRWETPRSIGGAVYSDAGALGAVLDVWVLAGSVLVLGVLAWRRLTGQELRWREPLTALGLAVLGGVLQFAALDRVAVTDPGVEWLGRASRHPERQRVVGRALADAALGAPEQALDADWLAGELKRLAGEGALRLPWRNPYTGAVVRLRDAPGDLALRRVEDGVRLVVFDAVGRASASRIRPGR